MQHHRLATCSHLICILEDKLAFKWNAADALAEWSRFCRHQEREKKKEKEICETNHRWVHPLKLHLMSSQASSDISSSTFHHPPPHLSAPHSHTMPVLPSFSPLRPKQRSGRRGHQSPSVRGCCGRVPGLRQIISCPHSHRTPHDVWEGRRWGNLRDQTGTGRGEASRPAGACQVKSTLKLTGWETALYILSIFFSAVQED